MSTCSSPGDQTIDHNIYWIRLPKVKFWLLFLKYSSIRIKIHAHQVPPDISTEK